jgi:hypothetical protein
MSYDYRDPMGIVANSFDQQAVSMGGRSLYESTFQGLNNIASPTCWANVSSAGLIGGLSSGVPGACMGAGGAMFNSFLQGGLGR